MSDVRPVERIERIERIDRLLDHAVDAVNQGRLDVARRLAEEVLATDDGNADAVALSGFSPAAAPPEGQLRRLTVMFCDLVGSTALSVRHEPEQYRHILRRYQQTSRQIVEGAYGGHLARVIGDGLLVLFGHPSAREDDVVRAVRAGLDLVAAIRNLSELAERALGESLAARVAVHRGLVYVDADEDDVYGLAANVAARLQELAPPASVVVSGAVLDLVRNQFDARAQEPVKVKGLDEPLASWRIVRERRRGRRPPVTTRPRQPTVPLVGREQPLAALLGAWAARPGVALVRGEAGLGKSRLVGALAAAVSTSDTSEDDRVRIVELAGSPDHPDVGFHPLRALVEQGGGIGSPQPGRQRLRRLRRHLTDVGMDADALLPLVAPVLGVEPDDGYVEAAADAGRLAAAIGDALECYLRALVGTGPALLVVEDLQWVDGPTREVLARVVGDLSPGLLVVATGRDGTPPLSTDPAATLVDLGPLSPADCRGLVAELDPDGVLAGAAVAVDELVARSDGVPLYLEHLVQAAVDTPHSPTDRPLDGRPNSSETGDPLGAADAQAGAKLADSVPDALYQPLVARLDATADGMSVVGAAATVGREFDVALLAQIVDLSPADLDRVLTALADGSVLEPVDPTERVPAAARRYRFRHELLREVAYELQPPSARRLLHGRVADTLAAAAAPRGGGAAWPTLASHYARANRPAAALDCYRQSADQARRRGALPEARADLDRAIGLLRDLPDDARRIDREVELRLRRGFIAVSTEGNASPTAAADYERCLDLATSGRSSDALFTTLVALWGYYASRAHLARARQVLGTLHTVLADGRAWAQPENDAGFGMLDWYAGRFAAAHERLELAVAAADDRASDAAMRAEWFLPNDPRTAMSTHLGLARFMRGDPGGADAAFAAADRLARALPFPQGPFSAAYNLTYTAWTQIQRGQHDYAERTIDQVQTLADGHGFDFWGLAAATQRAELAATRTLRAIAVTPAAASAANTASWSAVEPVAVSQVLAGLVMAWQMIDTRVFLPTVLTTTASTLAAVGDPAAAQARCAEALALAEETGSRFFVAETLRVQAHLATEPDDVMRGLRHSLELAIDQGAVPIRLRIAVDLHRRTGEEAQPDVVAAVAQFRPAASYPELDAARAIAESCS